MSTFEIITLAIIAICMAAFYYILEKEKATDESYDA